MIDYKNIGKSRIRQLQKRRERRRGRVDMELVTVAVLIFLGMATLVANW